MISSFPSSSRHTSEPPLAVLKLCASALLCRGAFGRGFLNNMSLGEQSAYAMPVNQSGEKMGDRHPVGLHQLWLLTSLSMAMAACAQPEHFPLFRSRAVKQGFCAPQSCMSRSLIKVPSQNGLQVGLPLAEPEPPT